MSRIQVNGNFATERLQTYARPMAPTEIAARPVEDGRWKALADVFAQGAGLADTVRQQAEADDAAAAKKWAQSMTVGELGKAIKEGKLLPSQSPVFIGTAQHIYGANTHEAGLRDMTTKLTTGELKFTSTKEADQYMTEWRNTSLAGQSEYAIRGFDKTYPETRQKVLDQVTKANNAKWVENAATQATDYLGNSFNRLASSDFKGTPQEAAAALMQDYQLLRHTKTLPDAVGKQAIGDLAGRVAMSGRKDILAALLDSDMEGLGTLRGVLGESKAQTLTHNALSAYDRDQRQRIDTEMLPWYKAADDGTLNVSKLEAWAADPANAKFVSSATVHSLSRANMVALDGQRRDLERAKIQVAVQDSEHMARQQVDAAIAEGGLWKVQGTGTPRVLTHSGDVREFDVKNYAAQSLIAKTSGTAWGMVSRWTPGASPTPQQIEQAAGGSRPMPLHQQVSAWAQNGLDNPNWKNELTAGFLNLATIGVASKGKPTGQLNEAGQRSIALFRELDAVNADYTRGLVGEKTYERFSDIGFLLHMGRNVDDAAGLAAAAASGAVADSDIDKLTKSIRAEVGKMQADPIYKWDFVQKAFGNNVTANTVQLTGTLRRYATLLAHSGQYGTAEDALGAAATYLAHPAVSAKINGTLYLRSEMPTGPAMRSQDDWFDKWLTAVPKARAKEMGFKDSEVRMEYDPTIKAYRGMVAALPLTNPDNSLFVVRKDDIQEWYGVQAGIEINNAAAKGAAGQQARTGVASDGAKVSDWAKNNFNKPGPASPPKAEPTAPQRNIPDIDWGAIKRPGSGKPAVMP